MFERLMAWLGFVPVEQLLAVQETTSTAMDEVEAAWERADRLERELVALKETPSARLAVVSEQAGRLVAAHGR